jgi:adenosylcobinamide-GDP ribazoletransferase
LWIFIAACIVTWGVGAWFTRKAGGITGDIIGFTSEVNEILCLLLAVIRHP